MNDNVPTISVFMKSYNHAQFIGEAIESVVQQDFEDLELIVVDDASTDGSKEIIEHYARDDSRIKTLFHAQNHGITKVVNDGINAANGTFIAQIDSDDIWARDKLRKQFTIIDQNEDAIVWSEGELVDQNSRSLGSTFSEMVQSTKKKKSGKIFPELLVRNYIFGSTLLYKRANLGDLRYDERFLYNNDYQFLLELAQKYEFSYLSEPLAKYRVHGGNTLAGVGVEAEKRRDVARMEEITIRQEALQRYGSELSDITKAEVYASIASCYSLLGSNKEARRFYRLAIRHNPYSRSTATLVFRALKAILPHNRGMQTE